jgi:hypothetical protein
MGFPLLGVVWDGVDRQLKIARMDIKPCGLVKGKCKGVVHLLMSMGTEIEGGGIEVSLMDKGDIQGLETSPDTAQETLMDQVMLDLMLLSIQQYG